MPRPLKPLVPGLLTEEQLEIGHASRPTSSWGGSPFKKQAPLPPESPYERPSSRSSGSYSKIPILAGSQTSRYPSYKFYSDIGDTSHEEYLERNMERDQKHRFADPPPTVKDLHAEATFSDTRWRNTSGKYQQILDPDSDVWVQYCEQALESDAELVAGLDGSLDVLLIFTGLFSAVLAALLIESYQQLQPNNEETSIELLRQIVSVLQDGSAFKPDDLNPEPVFTPTARALRINVLWFSSLALALGVSVLVMVAKQWLRKYTEGLSSVPHIRSRLRQYRYDSLRKWHLPEIVTSLPTMLHLALALFMVGLVEFLMDIHLLVALACGAVCLVFFIIYTTTTLLPHFYPDCPYKTPFSSLLAVFIYQIRCGVNKLVRNYRGVRVNLPPPRLVSIEESEYLATRQKTEVLQAQAISWLLRTSRKTDVITAAVQSLSGLSPFSSGIPILHASGALRLVSENLLSCFTEQRPDEALEEDDVPTGKVELQLIDGKAYDAGRYACALVALIQELPASRWPLLPPRDLHLFADVLDPALAELAEKTEEPDVVIYATVGREHIYRAGRHRYPGSVNHPSHSLGRLLDLTIEVAEAADDEDPFRKVSVQACVILLDTISRCVHAITTGQHRYHAWIEFSTPLLQILADTPAECRIRTALSRCIGAFAGFDLGVGGASEFISAQEAHDPVEHVLIESLSNLLVATVKAPPALSSQDHELGSLADRIATSLEALVQQYSKSFILSIRPLRGVLQNLLPVLSLSSSSIVKNCIFTVLSNADPDDMPPKAIQELVCHLASTLASAQPKSHSNHSETLTTLERILHKEGTCGLLLEAGVIEPLVALLNSTTVTGELASGVSSLLADICLYDMKLRKGAGLKLILSTGILRTISTYILRRYTDQDEGWTNLPFIEEKWLPWALWVLDQEPLRVRSSGILDVLGSLSKRVLAAYDVSQGDAEGYASRLQVVANLKEWWPRCSEWIRCGRKGPKPKPLGPLYLIEV